MGSTEVDGYGVLAAEPEFWVYYNFDPETGFSFSHYLDNLYETVIGRHTEPEKSGSKSFFKPFQI
jgi:hypothetical protein